MCRQPWKKESGNRRKGIECFYGANRQDSRTSQRMTTVEQKETGGNRRKKGCSWSIHQSRKLQVFHSIELKQAKGPRGGKLAAGLGRRAPWLGNNTQQNKKKRERGGRRVMLKVRSSQRKANRGLTISPGNLRREGKKKRGEQRKCPSKYD